MQSSRGRRARASCPTFRACAAGGIALIGRRPVALCSVCQQTVSGESRKSVVRPFLGEAKGCMDRRRPVPLSVSSRRSVGGKCALGGAEGVRGDSRDAAPAWQQTTSTPALTSWRRSNTVIVEYRSSNGSTMPRSSCHNNGRARRTVKSVRWMTAAARGAAFPIAHASVCGRAGDGCPSATNSTDCSKHGAIRSTHRNGGSAVSRHVLIREFPRCAVLWRTTRANDVRSSTLAHHA